MNNYNFSEQINNKNGYFSIYYEGSLEKEIDINELKRRINNYIKNIDFNREIDKIVGDIRTFFRDFNEIKLNIICKNKEEYYEISYCNKELFKYINNSSYDDIKSKFIFDYIRGINFDIQKNYITISSSYNDKYLKLYLERIKEVCDLKQIGINKITNEILYINEIYKLFYGRYPNYTSDNINIKIQNMIYVLYEYGINFVDEYYFSNINEKRIPVSSNINSLIDNVKPYGKINSENIIIDKKYKERIKIIRESIKKSCSKDIDFETATLYLSMVIYATKYNLKLGYTLEGITDTLKCSKSTAEKGLRLYKNINKNVYEKN